MFLSYAREDVEKAHRFADALVAAGHSVWWDRDIKGGTRFADEIDRALRDSEVVLVLWSPASVISPWVLDEAGEARDAGKILPALIGDCKPPLGHRQFQAIDLRTGPDGAYAELLKAIESRSATTVPHTAAAIDGPASKEKSVCVLPFRNLSQDPEQEYFSDGITEDVTTDLSKVSALKVIGRHTAFSFKGQSVDVREIARKLAVTHVLEGSVRKAGHRVRISAQLIDGHSGGHVWAERYDRDLTDIFRIQDEISEAIVSALKLRLLPEEKKAIVRRGTASSNAYDLYLMARQVWATGNHGDRRREERVIALCTAALGIDPNYSRAWALLAIAQSNLRYGLSDQDADDGVSAARRALAIDPIIAEAHCPIIRELAEHGRLAEAEAEIAIALQLDAESWEVNKEAARFYFQQRRIDEAGRHFEKATTLMESDFHAWGLLFSCYNAQGNQAGMQRAAKMVVQQVEKAIADDPMNGAALSLGATGLAVLGQKERAREWIDRALLINPENLSLRYNFACSLAASFGDVDAAIEMLEPAIAKSGSSTIKLAMKDPDLDGLRADPRFQKMLATAQARLGLVDEQKAPRG